MSKNYFCVRKRDFNKLQIFHKNRQLIFEVFKIKYLFKHLRKFKFRPSDSFFHRSLNPLMQPIFYVVQRKGVTFLDLKVSLCKT